jgi:hypothetical protein
MGKNIDRNLCMFVERHDAYVLDNERSRSDRQTIY